MDSILGVHRSFFVRVWTFVGLFESIRWKKFNHRHGLSTRTHRCTLESLADADPRASINHSWLRRGAGIQGLTRSGCGGGQPRGDEGERHDHAEKFNWTACQWELLP
jgi:hypothetical protein